jgi:hypothetical protein
MTDPILSEMQAKHEAAVLDHVMKEESRWELLNSRVAAFDSIRLSPTLDADTRYGAALAVHDPAPAKEWKLTSYVHRDAEPIADPTFDPRRPAEFAVQLDKHRDLWIVAPGGETPRGHRVVATLDAVAKAAEAVARRNGTSWAAREAIDANPDGTFDDDQLLQLGRHASGTMRVKYRDARGIEQERTVLVEKPADAAAESAYWLDRLLVGAEFPEEVRKLARSTVAKAVEAGDLRPLSRVVAHLSFVKDPDENLVTYARLLVWEPGSALPTEGRGISLGKLYGAARARAAAANVYGAVNAELHFRNPFGG